MIVGRDGPVYECDIGALKVGSFVPPPSGAVSHRFPRGLGHAVVDVGVVTPLSIKDVAHIGIVCMANGAGMLRRVG